MNYKIMMNPGFVPGSYHVFVCGNDESAKNRVKDLLKEIGWAPANILDLGDLTAARGTEMMLPVWLRIWQSVGTATFNFGVVK